MSAASFTWGDSVAVRSDAPAHLRPGSLAEVVGVSHPDERSGAFRDEFPNGVVYTIEFGDGATVQAPEAALQAASES